MFAHSYCGLCSLKTEFLKSCFDWQQPTNSNNALLLSRLYFALFEPNCTWFDCRMITFHSLIKIGVFRRCSGSDQANRIGKVISVLCLANAGPFTSHAVWDIFLLPWAVFLLSYRLLAKDNQFHGWTANLKSCFSHFYKVRKKMQTLSKCVLRGREACRDDKLSFGKVDGTSQHKMINILETPSVHWSRCVRLRRRHVCQLISYTSVMSSCSKDKPVQ